MEKKSLGMAWILVLLLAACGRSDLEVKLGEPFELYGEECAVEEINAHRILQNTWLNSIKVAPKGEVFVVVRVLTMGGDIFQDAFVGGSEIQALDVSEAGDFVEHACLSFFREKIYVLPEGQPIDRIEIRELADSRKIILRNLLPTPVEDPAVPPRLVEFMQEFAGGARILDVASKYCNANLSRVLAEPDKYMVDNLLLSSQDIFYLNPGMDTLAINSRGKMDVRFETYWREDSIAGLHSRVYPQ